LKLERDLAIVSETFNVPDRPTFLTVLDHVRF